MRVLIDGADDSPNGGALRLVDGGAARRERDCLQITALGEGRGVAERVLTSEA